MPESRRSYGTGSLFVRADAGGREHWCAKWRDGGRQVKRKVATLALRALSVTSLLRTRLRLS
jgi:hypothetical protein